MKRNKVLFVIAIVAMLAVLFVACDDSQPEHTHTYGAWTIATAPTETEAGTATRVCSCGDVETAAVAKLSDSSVWTLETSQDATHAGKGFKVYSSAYGKVTVEVAKGQHVYGGWTIVTEPTATEEGKAMRFCVCGNYEEVALAVLTDTSVWTKNEKQAQSDTEDGIVEYTSAYGKVTVTTPKAGHTYGAWTISSEPTETAAGVATRVCSCGDEQTHPVAKLTDTSVWTVSVNQEPSHTQGGVKVYTSVYGTVVKTSSQGAHTFGGWEITTDPTETATGVAKRYCSCGFFEQVTLPVLTNAEVWTKGETTATHYQPGTTTYTSEYGTVTIVTEVQQHVFGPWVANGDGKHTHTCDCGYSETKDCAFDQQVATSNYFVSDATCDTPARYYLSCVCGRKSTLTFTYGGALGHNYADFQVTNPTCTEDGEIYATCTRCDNKYSKTLEKLGHDHSGECIPYVVSPTSDEDGSVHHVYRCARCGEYDTENLEKHTFGEIVEYVLVSPTAGWHSVQSVRVCGDCGYRNHAEAFNGNYVESDSFFTKVDEKEADYNEAGYVEYTHKDTNTTFRIVKPKLTAPYEGVTYYAFELSQKEGTSLVKVDSFKSSVTFDKNGTGKGDHSPLTGDCTIKITDKNTGAITFTRVDGTSTYNERGYIDLSTGIVVMTKDSVYDSVYFMVPSTYSIKEADVNGAVWTGSMAISYGAECSFEFKHAFNFFVYDGQVYFGAKYTDLDGNPLEGADCATASYVKAVDAQGNKIQAFARNASGVLQVTDGIEGSYPDSTYKVVLNGVGGATIDGKAGVYVKATDKDYYELYVGESVEAATEYYTFTLAGKTISVTKPTATLTFDTTDEGITVASVDVNINVVKNLPTPDERAGYMFKGWKLNGEGEEMKSFKATTADMTYNFVASWTVPSQLTVKGLLAEDEAAYGSKQIGYGDTYVSALPNYDYNTTFNEGYTFAGWVLDTNGNGTLDDSDVDIQDEDVVTADGANIVVFAKWEWVGNVSFAQQSKYAWEYVAESNSWRSTNWHVTGGCSSTMEIKWTSGVASVEFDYWVTGEERYDYLTITYYDNAGIKKEIKTKGSDITKENAKHLVSILDAEGESVCITYSKDNSGNGDSGEEDRAFVVNLKINEVSVVAQNALFKNAGTYTNGTDEITVGAGGLLTIGANNYVYSQESATVIGATIEGVYKEFTLDTTAKTYTETEPKVTVTYDYKGHGTNSSAQVSKYSTVTLPTGLSPADGLTFEGWYTDAEFTTKAADTYVVSSDITFYARWVVPSKFTGEYTIVQINNSGVSNVYADDKTKLVVDMLGKAATTTNNGFGYGATVKIEFVEGSTSVVTITAVNTYGTETKYYGVYDETTGCIIRSEKAAGFTTATIYMMIPYNSEYKTTDFTTLVWSETENSDSTYYKFVGFEDKTASENASRAFFVAGSTDVAFDATWTAVDSSDNAVTALSDVKSKADLITIVASGKTYKLAKNSSGSFVVADGNEGTYTGTDGTQIRLNGAGVISGTFKGATLTSGRYTVSTDESYGFNVTATVNGTYSKYILSIKGDNTCTMEEDRVTISYVNDKVTVEPQHPFRSTSTALVPAEDVEVAGFKFRGWFENAEFKGSAKTSASPATDVTFYAKYDKAVTLTFDYNGYEYETGKTIYVVPDKYENDPIYAKDIPSVASDVRHNNQVFEGWYSQNGSTTGEWGDKVSTSTVLTGALTYYAKWVTPNVMVGKYTGFRTSTNTSTNVTKYYSETLEIDALGNATGGQSGSIVDYNEETGYFRIKTSSGSMIYAYYDSVNKVIIVAYNSGTDSFGTQPYFFFLDDVYKNVSIDNANALRWNSYNTGLYTFEYGDTSKTKQVIYVDNNRAENDKAYFGVTVYDITSGTAEVPVSNTLAKDGTIINIKKGDNDLATWGYANGTFGGNDGKGGSYRSDNGYGEIYVNGYGVLKLNVNDVETTASYTLDGDKVTFVAGNAMRTITLDVESKTYTKTLDGYQGTYTLPDASTLALDGYGNVTGTTKTYVVSGTRITIYDGEASTTYRIDKSNKTIKSLFGGYVFSGSYTVIGDSYWDRTDVNISIAFDNSGDITGTFTKETDEGYGSSTTQKVKFTATFDGTTLTLTFTEDVSKGTTFKGQTMVLTLSGNKLTIVSYSGTDTALKGKTLTCSNFNA